ncbi:MAG: trigger factor [Prevotellaceae bacterium]|jgi:trigger factor|nr:trigger factor [Prevotellaceae bacterium]
MDIIKQNIDELGALLKVQIVKSDYEEAVRKSLNAHRRKAEIKGFRPGMAPVSLIQKMYGRSILIEEINKLIMESLEKYLETEKLDLVGEPIPCDDEQKSIDWDNQNDFEFVYEIGYAPKYEFKADPTVEVPFYNITISDEDKTDYIDRMRMNYGKFEDAETAGENDIVRVNLDQDGENALKVEDAFISMALIENKEQKSRLLGIKVGETVAININDIYDKDEQKASLLRIKKEELEKINPEFNITVIKIRTSKKADINQELFDAAYGKDSIKSEEEFMQKVTAEMEKSYEESSNYKFAEDVRKTLIEKADLKFPETFLKKWLLLVNENKFTAEQIDSDFDFFLRDLSWQIISTDIAKENDIKVEEADIKAAAMETARNQLMHYGMKNLPDEQLENFAQRLTNSERGMRDIAKKVIDNKVFEYLKTTLKLEEINLNIDDFNKLFD